MHHTRFKYILAYHTYRRCEVRTCGNHCVHQQPQCLLVWNIFHFVLCLYALYKKLWQQGLYIDWGYNGFTIRYAEPLQNAFDVATFVHGDDARR